MSPTVSLIGIILGLACMIFMAWKGISVYIFGPVSAIVVMIFSGLPIMDTLTNVYMPGFVSFAQSNFLLFMLSAMFAKVMGDSGAAKVIAIKIVQLANKSKKNKEIVAMLCIQLVTVVLTLGGINLFVVVFLMVGIARNVYKELGIAWHLYNTGSWASGTITMTMIPGTPAIQNLIPMEYLGTTPTAAPIMGTICAIVCFLLELLHINYALRKTKKNGEGFFPSGEEIDKREMEVDMTIPDYNFIVCLIPSIVLLVVMNVFGVSPVLSLVVAIVVAYILFRKTLPHMGTTLGDGAVNSIGVITSVCAVVGFGSVVAASSGYEMVLGALTNLPGPPVVQLAVAVNVAAGFSGSASGGLTIAMNALSQRFLDMGMDPQVIHRVACISCGGLDSLPHNGNIVSSLRVAGLNHKNGYMHIFWQCTAIPLVITALSCILATIGIV